MQSNPKKVHFISNACEEGRLNTEKLKLISEESGLTPTSNIQEADYIIFNACGHLKEKDTEAVYIIEKIKSQKRDSAKLIVWGCLTKINPQAILKVHDGPLVSPEDWAFFSTLFNHAIEKTSHTFAHSPYPLTRNPSFQIRLNTAIFERLFSYRGKTWFIKIVIGCRHCCTYCSDHLVYKAATSVPVEDILKQVKLGLDANIEHFFFVGRDLGSYGFDIKSSLADLLNKIPTRFPYQQFKMSLLNVSPDALIDLYPKLDPTVLSKHIFQIGSHIQSGSEKILTLMGKTTNLNEWKKTIHTINKNYPNIRLATSIIVGFPGETEYDFQKTLQLLKDLPLDRVDVYTYDERPNLPSLTLPDRILAEKKIERFRKVKAVARNTIYPKRLRNVRITY